MSAGDLSETYQQDIADFYDFLYGQRQGYVYATTKEPIYDSMEAPPWKRHFFRWPDRKADLVKFTVISRAKHEVYVAPALFRTNENATKENVLGANVVWVELDDPPKDPEAVPPPTCRVSSGGEGHEHWYWKLDQVLNAAQLDLLNETLTYALDADPSGWDCTQVLRPPSTFNHKRKRETSWAFKSDAVLSVSLFGSLPEPPIKGSVETPSYIPPVEQVVAKYTFSDTVAKLFFSREPNDRSDALMALGYHCAEMGMHPPEILAMILNADERWGKFKGRHDQMTLLMQIVSIATKKYPKNLQGASTAEPVSQLLPMGFKTLLATDVELEWIWDGMLQKNGYFLLTGPTGVGKTQFSLNAAAHMALGQPFLGHDTKQARIGFFSLEMGLVDLKHFLQQMEYTFTLEEQNVLEENLQIFPLGEPLYLTDPAVRSMLDQLVGDMKLDGIMVDSLGSATPDNVSDESFKKFFHWNDTFRQRHDAFTWYLHHHRKAGGDNRKPNKISDVYGSQYITSYATTVVCLWPGGLPNVLEHISLKSRLTPTGSMFNITRDSNLRYMRTQAGQVIQAPHSPLSPLSAGSAPTGPAPAGRPPQGHRDGLTGAWSTGPTTWADLGGSKAPPDDEPFNLNFKGLD